MVVRALDDTYVTEKRLRRKKSCLLVQDGAEELVSRAESLHENVTLSVVNELDSLSDSLELIRVINDVKFGSVDAVLFANFIDHLRITHKCGLDETEVNSL